MYVSHYYGIIIHNLLHSAPTFVFLIFTRLPENKIKQQNEKSD